MLVLIDDSVILKDIFLDSKEMKAISEHSNVVLCQVVLDNVYADFSDKNNEIQLSEYQSYIDRFLLDNGSVYPEKYPVLTDLEKKCEIAEDTSYLFWKNCYDIFIHYVLEDIHVISERKEFFDTDSKLYSIIQSDIEKCGADKKAERLHFWNGINSFYHEYFRSYMIEKKTQEQILQEIQDDITGFAEPLEKTVLSLMDIDSLPENIKPVFEVMPVFTDIIINGYEIENIAETDGDIYTLEVCVECDCTLMQNNNTDDSECGDYESEMCIYCILKYNVATKSAIECKLDYIDDGSCNFC